MRRTYIDRIAEHYQCQEDDLDLMMGMFSRKGRWSRHDVEESRVFGSASSRRLLVVDDEARIRDTYQKIFSKKGFDVLTAADAMNAKDLLVRERVGIVFLDINMAEVDGGILFELVRAFHPGVKVVVSSVYPVEEQKERIRGADAYFDKSDGKYALLNLVSSLMGREEEEHYEFPD
ncbi:MAG: response regulator [Candidatus Omnitrophica bacterium]|nr:response regulator [Candidatus Omnitrophota bacterium]